jgi:hypothetical protein
MGGHETKEHRQGVGALLPHVASGGTGLIVKRINPPSRFLIGGLKARPMEMPIRETPLPRAAEIKTHPNGP